jgi:cell division protein FtsZ
MGDEICVTVVATGLGGQQIERPTKVIDNTKHGSKNVDFNSLDRPAVMRKSAGTAPELDKAFEEKPALAKAVGAESDMDYLDIPAFLRKQAD